MDNQDRVTTRMLIQDLREFLTGKVLQRKYYTKECDWRLEISSSGFKIELLKSDIDNDIVVIDYIIDLTVHPVEPESFRSRIKIKTIKGYQLFKPNQPRNIGVNTMNPDTWLFLFLGVVKSKHYHDYLYIELSTRRHFHENGICTMLNCDPMTDLEKLLATPDRSDFTLALPGNVSFRVHKNILAARSPVFSAMFTSDMEEKVEKLEMLDSTDDVIKEFIRYLYTGRVENLEQHAKDLLKLADTYDLDNLKIWCLTELCYSLTIDNAIEVLLLTNLYKIQVLKDTVLDFIADNIKDMIDMENFKSIMEHQQLTHELFTVIASKQGS